MCWQRRGGCPLASLPVAPSCTPSRPRHLPAPAPCPALHRVAEAIKDDERKAETGERERREALQVGAVHCQLGMPALESSGCGDGQGFRKCIWLQFKAITK